MTKNKVETLECYAPNDRWAHEDNDCVVCAMSNVTDATYADVHGVLKAHGRQNNKGFATYNFLQLKRTVLDHTFDHVGLGKTGMTLRSFALENSKGTFLVCIRRHALCVIDGIIVESNRRVKLTARVLDAWKVTKDSDFNFSTKKD